jgi:hypothetical protein
MYRAVKYSPVTRWVELLRWGFADRTFWHGGSCHTPTKLQSSRIQGPIIIEPHSLDAVLALHLFLHVSRYADQMELLANSGVKRARNVRNWI